MDVNTILEWEKYVKSEFSEFNYNLISAIILNYYLVNLYNLPYGSTIGIPTYSSDSNAYFKFFFLIYLINYTALI